MLRAALRDLQWRRKRFVITIIGTALVFAMSLLMSGLSNSFSVEVDRTLDGAGRRVVGHTRRRSRCVQPRQLPHPHRRDRADRTDAPASRPPRRCSTARRTAETKPGRGGERGDQRHRVRRAPPASSARRPTVVEGTTHIADGEVIVPRKLGVHVGDIDPGRGDRPGGRRRRGQGVAARRHADGHDQPGRRAAADARGPAAGVDGGGARHAVVADRATGRSTRAEAKADLHATVAEPARSRSTSSRSCCGSWPALIVASVVYLTVLERTRDIAVFKATGVQHRGHRRRDLPPGGDHRGARVAGGHRAGGGAHAAVPDGRGDRRAAVDGAAAAARRRRRRAGRSVGVQPHHPGRPGHCVRRS